MFLVTFFIAAILPPLLPSGILQLWRNVPGFWQLLQPRLSELMDPLRSMKNAIQLRVKLTTSLARESTESFRAPAAFLRGLLTNTAEMSSEALSGLVMALRNLAFSKTKLHQIKPPVPKIRGKQHPAFSPSKSLWEKPAQQSIFVEVLRAPASLAASMSISPVCSVARVDQKDQAWRWWSWSV